MKPRVFPIFLVLLPWCCAASTVASDPSLDGYWSFVSVTVDGKPEPLRSAGNGILFYDNKIVFDHPLNDARTLVYSANRHTTPMRLNIHDELGKVCLMTAIYEIKGESLEICIGDPRPNVFATKRGDKRTLYMLKRRKND